MRGYIRVTVILLCLLGMAVSFSWAQQGSWALRTQGFMDNGEGDATYRTPHTHTGLRLTPELGLTWAGGRHTFVGGVSAITQWGDRSGHLRATPVVYYRLKSDSLTLLMGSFMREMLSGDYPEYMLSDTICYYRPVMQGLAVMYRHGESHAEAWVDWTSRRTTLQREQFMAGVSARLQGTHLGGGIMGYYYHYALTWNASPTDHIHDYLIARPYVSLRWEAPARRTRLEVRGGLMMSLDRERGDNGGWHTPLGFLGEGMLDYRRLHVMQTVYAGGKQQPFGRGMLGRYYWGDTYYAAPWYSRTDLLWKFAATHGVEASTGVKVHVTSSGVNVHQLITLRAYLDGVFGRL